MAIAHRRISRPVAAVAGLILLVAGGALAGCGSPARHAGLLTPVAAPSGAPSPRTSEPALPAAPAPVGLRVIDYGPAPAGFPADPEPMSAAPLTEGLHPEEKIPVYDAPGGQARAYVAPTLSGVPLVMPIVTRRAGWVAVLLPSVNRTIGWLPEGGWSMRVLRDQLVLRLAANVFTWYRDGTPVDSWKVTVGAAATPTPLGRSFVLARTRLNGSVYAGLDGLALGSIPDRPNSVPTGLRGAHIGIHSWYRNDFGGYRSNGCIRVPKAGHQRLLDEIDPGTEVLVLR